LKAERSREPTSYFETVAATEYLNSCDEETSNAVFDVIGYTAVALEPAQESAIALSEPVDVIAGLYSQYLLALDNGDTGLSKEWVGAAVQPESHTVTAASGNASPSAFPDDRTEATDSIEALLGRTHLLEQAFGPLGLGEARELIATEPVPEILQLFAPYAYQAAASRRIAQIPPALARREHHSVSIDSAMPVPRALAEQSDAP
jgi:hypothetical protein